MGNQTSVTEMKRGKKITAEIVKFSDFEVGHSVKGKYLTTTERQWTDKETGEAKTIPVFVFETENGARFNVFGDAGLVNAMTSAGVQNNQWIEIEKLEQIELKGGRRVNQYEIYDLN